MRSSLDITRARTLVRRCTVFVRRRLAADDDLISSALKSRFKCVRRRSLTLGKASRNIRYAHRHRDRDGAAADMNIPHAVEYVELFRNAFVKLLRGEYHKILVALIFLENAAAFLRPLGQDRRYLRRASTRGICPARTAVSPRGYLQLYVRPQVHFWQLTYIAP